MKPSTPQQRVKRRMPNAGAELSAMHGWRIVDYTDQQNPVPLNRGCKSEAEAWRSVDRRGVVRHRAPIGETVESDEERQFDADFGYAMGLDGSDQ